MIDVIIPAYNAHKTIERTLFSIAYQENIEDIEVTIVNDNSKKDYLEIVNYFKNFMKIKEITLKENRGPGYARQCGIDNTKNPYIVFIDSDDIFYSFNSIKTLYDTITKDDFDYVGSNFIEETEDEKIEIENNDAWVHGKIYKRSFLIENNIKFLFSSKGEKEINKLINNIKELNIKKYNDDITKIILKSEKYSGYELSDILFNKFNIEDERTNEKSTMLLCGIGTDKNKLLRLKQALNYFGF